MTTEQIDNEDNEKTDTFCYQQEEYVARINDVVAGISDIHSVTINKVQFYRIQDAWWQLSYIGADSKGIYACFFRVKGEYEGY